MADHCSLLRQMACCTYSSLNHPAKKKKKTHNNRKYEIQWNWEKAFTVVCVVHNEFKLSTIRTRFSLHVRLLFMLLLLSTFPYHLQNSNAHSFRMIYLWYSFLLFHCRIWRFCGNCSCSCCANVMVLHFIIGISESQSQWRSHRKSDNIFTPRKNGQ